MKKLNVGCGKTNFGKEWIHIDSNMYKHVNVRDDIRNLRKHFDDNTVDVIYASHVIEYFDEDEVVFLLTDWYRLLKSTGILRIAVPDFRVISMLYYNKLFGLDSFLGPIYGKRLLNRKFIYHKMIYDFDKIKKILEKIGFTSVHRYNWKTTDHSNFDDCSQAYLPKMNKKDGVLISLNVQATKNNFSLYSEHGMFNSRTHDIWMSTLFSKNVDKRWHKFQNFFDDMGECPRNGNLTKINSKTEYCKSNCIWTLK